MHLPIYFLHDYKLWKHGNVLENLYFICRLMLLYQYRGVLILILYQTDVVILLITGRCPSWTYLCQTDLQMCPMYAKSMLVEICKCAHWFPYRLRLAIEAAVKPFIPMMVLFLFFYDTQRAFSFVSDQIVTQISRVNNIYN